MLSAAIGMSSPSRRDSSNRYGKARIAATVMAPTAGRMRHPSQAPRPSSVADDTIPRRWASQYGSIPTARSGAVRITGQSGECGSKNPPNTVTGPRPSRTLVPMPTYFASS